MSSFPLLWSEILFCLLVKKAAQCQGGKANFPPCLAWALLPGRRPRVNLDQQVHSRAGTLTLINPTRRSNRYWLTPTLPWVSWFISILYYIYFRWWLPGPQLTLHHRGAAWTLCGPIWTDYLHVFFLIIIPCPKVKGLLPGLPDVGHSIALAITGSQSCVLKLPSVPGASLLWSWKHKCFEVSYFLLLHREVLCCVHQLRFTLMWHASDTGPLFSLMDGPFWEILFTQHLPAAQAPCKHLFKLALIV
jgi:hypothetical protein